MKIGKTFNKVINSPYLSASIFLASGGYKIYDDYKVADDKYKKKMLVIMSKMFPDLSECHTQ